MPHSTPPWPALRPHPPVLAPRVHHATLCRTARHGTPVCLRLSYARQGLPLRRVHPQLPVVAAGDERRGRAAPTPQRGHARDPVVVWGTVLHVRRAQQRRVLDVQRRLCGDVALAEEGAEGVAEELAVNEEVEGKGAVERKQVVDDAGQAEAGDGRGDGCGRNGEEERRSRAAAGGRGLQRRLAAGCQCAGAASGSCAKSAAAFYPYKAWNRAGAFAGRESAAAAH